MQSDSYSPTDHLTAENTSNCHSILCNLVHYNITHFYVLISLSPDWPYRSTLTIPYVACSQTHSSTDHLTAENTSNCHSVLCYLVPLWHQYALRPHLTIFRLTVLVNSGTFHVVTHLNILFNFTFFQVVLYSGRIVKRWGGGGGLSKVFYQLDLYFY